jgi:S-adenosylmethionine:tRNA ribosyltransferase-isomerase
MKTSDFDYVLPEELIAQNPLPQRDQAKLMVLNQDSQTIEHQHISDLLDILTPNDVLVFNETKVFPARLKGTIENKPVEILLHREVKANEWECLTKPGKRFKLNSMVQFEGLSATVTHINEDGSRILKFPAEKEEFRKQIDKIGETPLPPYINKSDSAPEQYQTVFAKTRGSVAAPTAGLHFTEELLNKLKAKGIEQHFVTLHVGRGTFEPVKVEDLNEHTMHVEWYEVSKQTAEALNQAKEKGKRIIAVGTTTTRTLESCSKDNHIQAQSGETDLFITPGYTFQFIDGMITNFHLPKSTLLMLISALAGKDFIEKAYQTAIAHQYRFYSFGDGMLIL